MAFKEHIGTVVKIENNKMYIKFAKELGCHACEHKDSCGINEESNTFDFEKLDNISVGDQVKISIEEKTVIKSAILVYIIPIIILIIFAFVGEILKKFFNFSEIFSPLLSVFGVIVYFIFLRFRYKNKKLDMKIEVLK